MRSHDEAHDHSGSSLSVMPAWQRLALDKTVPHSGRWACNSRGLKAPGPPPQRRSLKTARWGSATHRRSSRPQTPARCSAVHSPPSRSSLARTLHLPSCRVPQRPPHLQHRTLHTAHWVCAALLVDGKPQQGTDLVRERAGPSQ